MVVHFIGGKGQVVNSACKRCRERLAGMLGIRGTKVILERRERSHRSVEGEARYGTVLICEDYACEMMRKGGEAGKAP